MVVAASLKPVETYLVFQKQIQMMSYLIIIGINILMKLMFNIDLFRASFTDPS